MSLIDRKHTHAGPLPRDDVMSALGLSVVELARHLGVGADTLNRILNERQSIDIDLATRLGRLCGKGPGLWLRMPAAHDAWQAARIDTSAIPTLRAA